VNPSKEWTFDQDQVIPMTKSKLNAVLRLDKAEIKTAKVLRSRSIEGAIALPGGPSRERMKLHVLWSGEGYEVGVGKPGKETERKEVSNPNDMWPYIKKDGKFAVDSASFLAISREMQHMKNKSRHALELLACLFVRSSYMLDHVERDGRVLYAPPSGILAEIKKDIPTAYGVPLEVFLQYLEAIALNEDVKYTTKGKLRGKPYGPGSGRMNNLSSCAHLIAVLLDRADLIDYAYGYSQMRGVSPLTFKGALQHFPLLGEIKNENPLTKE